MVRPFVAVISSFEELQLNVFKRAVRPKFLCNLARQFELDGGQRTVFRRGVIRVAGANELLVKIFQVAAIDCRGCAGNVIARDREVSPLRVNFNRAFAIPTCWKIAFQQNVEPGFRWAVFRV